jgi:predicted dehydrogenase
MRIGVLGAGKIGQLRATTVREHPGVRLAAVYDSDVQRARRAAGRSGAVVAASFEELLDLPLDALFVCTPAHLHEAACLAAFDRGLHVLVEKPLTNGVDSARRVVEAALRARRSLAVGFNLRYYPVFKFVRAAIASGSLGDIRHFRVFGGHEGLPKFVHDWEYRAPQSGGGALWDVGIHMTDLARHLLGEITEVYGVVSDRTWQVPGSEDNAMAILRNPEGTGASYHATWTEWRGYHIHVEAHGDRGMVRAEYAPMRNTLVTKATPGGKATTRRRFYPHIVVREKVFGWQTTALQSFREELADFLQHVAGRRDGTIADGYAGLRAIEVAAAVVSSAASGNAVRLPALGCMPA